MEINIIAGYTEYIKFRNGYCAAADPCKNKFYSIRRTNMLPDVIGKVDALWFCCSRNKASLCNGYPAACRASEYFIAARRNTIAKCAFDSCDCVKFIKLHHNLSIFASGRFVDG